MSASFDINAYELKQQDGQGAIVEHVYEGSPADKAGIKAGMRIERVNGKVLLDLIDWRWEADDYSCELTVFDPFENITKSFKLHRDCLEDWGIEFSDVVFDGIKTCVNACTFCFMSMLPKDMRSSLSLRDDDYRLSFLQGNFVTLTNCNDDDLKRIIDHHLSPMNVSLHALSHDVRRRLIGAHEAQGITALDTLIDAGIEIHAQIVLCPGINDGEELVKTLEWVEARPSITSLALVPVGYTRYSKHFKESYSDDPQSAQAVIRLVEPFQRRSKARDGLTRFQLSDEFYVAAQMEPPSKETYDDYPQYYDGIGMLRVFLDEAASVTTKHKMRLERVEEILIRENKRALLICGEAAFKTIQSFADAWSRSGIVQALAIKNKFFGGDVNVTGLLCAQDILAQLQDDLTNTICVLPQVMFNFDDVTLDGVSKAELSSLLHKRGAQVLCSLPNPMDYLLALESSFKKRT